MPVPAYMSLEGQKQGNISQGAGGQDSIGGKSRSGHEDEIMVQGYEHQIIQPTDVQSGAPTGKRLHKEVRILKQYDGASPLLLNALCSGEQLKGSIKWFRISPEGDEQHLHRGDRRCGMHGHGTPHAQLPGRAQQVPGAHGVGVVPLSPHSLASDHGQGRRGRRRGKA